LGSAARPTSFHSYKTRKIRIRGSHRHSTPPRDFVFSCRLSRFALICSTKLLRVRLRCD